MTEAKPRRAARAFIANEERKIMLGRRAKGISAGEYSLIGGKLDEGETEEQAIRREVWEETGLVFKPEHEMKTIDSTHNATDPWIVYYFFGIAEGTLKLDPREIADVIYVAEEDLDSVAIAFDHKDRLREYFQSRR